MTKLYLITLICMCTMSIYADRMTAQTEYTVRVSDFYELLDKVQAKRGTIRIGSIVYFKNSKVQRIAIPQDIAQAMLQSDTVWVGMGLESFYFNGKCFDYSYYDRAEDPLSLRVYDDDLYLKSIATGRYGTCYHTRFYARYDDKAYDELEYIFKIIKAGRDKDKYIYKVVKEIYESKPWTSAYGETLFKVQFIDDYQYTRYTDKDVYAARKAKESDERRHPARYLLFDLYGASSTINKYRHTDEARQTVCAALVYGLRYDTYARNKFQRRKDTIRRLAIPEDVAEEIVQSDTIWVETPLPGRVLMDDYSWRELYYYGDGKCFGFTYDRYKNKVELRLVTHTDADSPVFDCIKRVAAGKYGVSYHTRYYSTCSDEANIDNYRRALKEYTYVTKYVKVGARKGRNIYRYAGGVFERKFSDSSVKVNGEVVYPFELYKIQFLDNYEYPDPYHQI